ncbi:hypothetical protein G4V62_18900 [Bacillaceae bacterium SIJ1]|uniref:hypothetical protein n=1 Tax=Litoribacterium kuwaitense TaxID=1398745 RepID=UPI0013EB166D|nr:hypothetical protein [Litoribacterium kuwaitense]NGP46897.1 hypothetical protein [Litoribacterium kuwaitense]
MRIGETINIIYMAGDGRFTKRKVKVLAVTDQYIRGMCQTKRKIRTFRKENILGVRKVAPAS